MIFYFLLWKQAQRYNPPNVPRMHLLSSFHPLSSKLKFPIQFHLKFDQEILYRLLLHYNIFTGLFGRLKKTEFFFLNDQNTMCVDWILQNLNEFFFFHAHRWTVRIIAIRRRTMIEWDFTITYRCKYGSPNSIFPSGLCSKV